MKWFKHFADANRDQKLIEIKAKFGLWGIAAYWYILERISDRMPYDKNPSTTCMFSWPELMGYLLARRKLITSYLLAIDYLNLCKVCIKKEIIIISCPKLLILKDNALKNLQGACKKLANNLPQEEEEEVEEEKALKNQQAHYLTKGLNHKNIDLSDISISNNGETLSEASKHKIHNELLILFNNRGWNTVLIKSVLRACAESVRDTVLIGDFYPYFEKACVNYINQNSEALNYETKKERKREND